MTGTIVKTNVAGIYKDQETGQLINKNIHELDTYRLRLRQKKRENELEQRVTILERKLDELIRQIQK